MHALRGEQLGGRPIGGTVFHPARGRRATCIPSFFSVASRRGGGERMGCSDGTPHQTPRNPTGYGDVKGACDGEKVFRVPGPS